LKINEGHFRPKKWGRGESVWGILNTQCKARADAAILKKESNERTNERKKRYWRKNGAIY
jgi:hypothetical protein